jgi:hypothetical protein
MLFTVKFCAMKRFMLRHPSIDGYENLVGQLTDSPAHLLKSGKDYEATEKN